MVDDVVTVYCDSNTGKAVPKQDWMNKVTGGDPQYWDQQSQICVGQHQVFKSNIEIAKERFNQTGGVFIFHFLFLLTHTHTHNVVVYLYGIYIFRKRIMFNL